MKFSPSSLWSSLAPLIGLLLCSLLASLLSFGLFFPYRLKEASLNGLVGCLIIATCHLSAFAIPVLLLHARRSWWSMSLLACSLVLLTFDSAVYQATGAAAGYYDYLNLTREVGAVSNAVSEYGKDGLRATAQIACLFGLLLTGSWVSRRSLPRIRQRLALRNTASPILLIGLCSLVVSTGFCASFYFRGHNATRGLVPGYGLPLSLAINAADRAMRQDTPLPQQVSVPTKRAHHILLIIDESVNFEVFRQLWSTTPHSAVTGPPLPMLSYANSSAASNVMLRHACDPRWPDRSLNSQSLLSKAKAAGYRIVYYDNQAVIRKRDNYFGFRERSLIDHHREADPEEIQPDITCLPDLIADLNRSQEPTFILINKRGSHFTYTNNFTPEQARPGEPPYHTSVRINTIEFLQRLIDSGVLAHTSLYFTSDHGEDWQKKVPHGTTDPAISHRPQWEVPALALQPNSPRSSSEIPAGHWLSHFHLVEQLNNELGHDDPQVPSIAQALDPAYELNGDHQALFVFPFQSLGREPDRKSLSRRD